MTSYVDDTTFFVTSSNEVVTAKEEIREFGEETGLLVNERKTKALPVGRWDPTEAMPYPVVEQVKVLGVQLCADPVNMPMINWPSRIAAFRGALVDARLRAFDLLQRARYANTYAFSILWHTAFVVPLPKTTAKEIDKAVRAFLWAGYLLKGAMEVVIQPAARGGLGLHSVQHRAHAMLAGLWTARSTSSSFSGLWLAELRRRFPPGRKLPRCVEVFRTVRDLDDDALPVSAKSRVHAIYAAQLEALEAQPRVQQHHPQADWQAIWRSVSANTLSSPARSEWFKVCHNLLPTTERLHRIAWGAVRSPLCQDCGVTDDVVHHLAECGPERRAVWSWASRKLQTLLGKEIEASVIVRPELPNAKDNPKAAAAIWLLGVVVSMLTSSNKLDVERAETTLRRRRSAANLPPAVAAEVATL